MELFWRTIDKCIKIPLGRKETTISQFYYSKKTTFKLPTEEQKTIHTKILSTDDNYEKGIITYKSLIDNNPCNENIEIKYFKNKKNKNAKNFILIHGWKQESFKELNDIMFNYLIENNHNIYYFLLPFHMDRMASNAKFSGEFLITANLDRTVLSFTQAVSDLQTLVKYLKKNNNGKIVTTGLSLGCIVNNLLVSFEKVDINISLFFPNNLAYLIFNSPVERYLGIELINNDIDENDLNNAWKSIVPSNYKPLIPKENMLFISGRYDDIVLIEDSDKLRKSWNINNYIELKCSHSGIGLMKKRILLHVSEFLSNF